LKDANSRRDFFAMFARDNPHAKGVLGNEDGICRFTEINLRPVVTILKKEDHDEVIHVLEKVERSCLVARSLQCKVVLPYCED
jgi:organic hydroperoxide reductase OsmC/OhrA